MNFVRSLLVFFSSVFVFSNALAADEATTKPNVLMNFAPLILISAVMYLFLIRPQQKKIKEQKNMINQLKEGDTVVTSSGIIGKIAKALVEDSIIHLEIDNNVIIKISKDSIVSKVTA